jgi:hypothetical protein
LVVVDQVVDQGKTEQLELPLQVLVRLLLVEVVVLIVRVTERTVVLVVVHIAT